MRRALALVLAVLPALPGAASAVPLAELVEERARDTLGAELPASGVFAISVQGQAGEEDAVMLSAFWMDPSTGQFLANAVMPDGQQRRIAGLALVQVPTPVPVRRIMPDEILTEADLTVAELPMGRLGAFAVTEAAALVGKQVRRVLSPGRPVMAQSVMEPLVIDRGEKVRITFRDGALELAAPGRALTDAHRGQEVRIVNLASNKSLTAVATGDGEVEVVR